MNDAGTPELQAKRAALVGSDEPMLQRRSTYALGVLRARRKIGQGDLVAGNRLAWLFIRTSGKRPTPQMRDPEIPVGLVEAGIPFEDEEVLTDEELRREYLGARQVLTRLGRRVEDQVVNVAIEDRLPRWVGDTRKRNPQGQRADERDEDALTTGLGSLAEYFEAMRKARDARRSAQVAIAPKTHTAVAA